MRRRRPHCCLTQAPQAVAPTGAPTIAPTIRTGEAKTGAPTIAPTIRSGEAKGNAARYVFFCSTISFFLTNFSTSGNWNWTRSRVFFYQFLHKILHFPLSLWKNIWNFFFSLQGFQFLWNSFSLVISKETLKFIFLVRGYSFYKIIFPLLFQKSI